MFYTDVCVESDCLFVVQVLGTLTEMFLEDEMSEQHSQVDRTTDAVMAVTDTRTDQWQRPESSAARRRVSKSGRVDSRCNSQSQSGQ